MGKLEKTLRLVTEFALDMSDYIRYCGISPLRDRQKALFYKIIIETHSLEKGLAVRNTRPGFGKEKVDYIMKALDIYDTTFSLLPAEMALGALEAYVEFHHNIGFSDSSVVRVQQFLSDCTIELKRRGGLRNFEQPTKLGQNRVGEDFLLSRFSCRIYDPYPLTNEEVRRIVQVAQSAPSQCNRQASKAYFFHGREKISELVELQAGARGFSEDISGLFVITSELAAWGGAQQRNQPYIDGSLFSMSVLLACHAGGFACCPLNLATTHRQSRKIRAAAGINPGEVLIMMIAVGRLPSVGHVKAARSPRRSLDEILSIQG